MTNGFTDVCGEICCEASDGPEFAATFGPQPTEVGPHYRTAELPWLSIVARIQVQVTYADLQSTSCIC